MSTPKKNKPVKGKQTGVIKGGAKFPDVRVKVAAPTMEALIQVIIDLDSKVARLEGQLEGLRELVDLDSIGADGALERMDRRVEALEAAPHKQHYQHPVNNHTFDASSYFRSYPSPETPYWYAMPPLYTND